MINKTIAVDRFQEANLGRNLRNELTTDINSTRVHEISETALKHTEFLYPMGLEREGDLMIQVCIEAFNKMAQSSQPSLESTM